MNTQQIVTAIYDVAFDRAPDAAGLAHHVQLLESGLIDVMTARSTRPQTEKGHPDMTAMSDRNLEDIIKQAEDAATLYGGNCSIRAYEGADTASALAAANILIARLATALLEKQKQK